MRRLLLLPMVLLLAAGCATMRTPTRPAAVPPSTHEESVAEADARRSQAAPPTYNLAGYPPAVREGYIDGCESAKRSRYGRKDAGRMANDAQYAMGWNDGFSICQKK
jgi:hypothetical protein